MNVPRVSNALCPVFVGRDAVLDAFDELLVDTVRGHGHIRLISGEAGIGKSRLIAEIATRAALNGMEIASGYCFETDRATPLAPLVDLLRSALKTSSTPETLRILSPQAPELVRLLPELMTLIPGLVPTPQLAPEQERRRLFQALTEALVCLAARQPLMIVIEDLHWSDDTSLDFLLVLARQILTQPIALILSYRSDEIHPTLQHVLAMLDRERNAPELLLARLGRDVVEQMLRAIFVQTWPVNDEFVETIYALTEGNPFFVEEVVKSLITSEQLVQTDGRWVRVPESRLGIPRSVQDAVQRRSGQLTPDAKELLALASVAGRRFHFELLCQLTGYDERSLLNLIKQFIAAQLVVEESADCFAFRHALTHQAVYRDLLTRERRALHQNVAATIERLYAPMLDAHRADLAYHYDAAGEWEKVLEHAPHAGEQAQALDAPRAAIEQFTRALGAAQQLGRTPPLHLYRARGLAYETVGGFEQAQADHDMTLDLARAAHERQVEWRALLDLGFLWTSRNYARTGAYYQQALTLARDMGDTGRLAHSLNQVGNWFVNSEQPLDGLRHHHEALTLFEAANDQQGMAETLDLLGLASRRSGDSTAGAAYYQRAIHTFRELGDRRGLVSSLSTLILCAYNCSATTTISAAMSFDERRRAGEEALRISRDIGWRAGEAYALLCLSFCLGAEGTYGLALQHAQESLAIAEAIDHRQWMTTAYWSLGVLHLDVLSLAEAQCHLAHALDLARAIDSHIWMHHVVGWLAPTYVAQGELQQAELLLQMLPADAPMQTLGERQCWCARAELALAHGDALTARLIADQLLASAPHREDLGEIALPRLAKLRGEALAALGQSAEAEAALRHAEHGARNMGLRPLRLRIHLALGRLYLAEHRPIDAEREFAMARDLVQDLSSTVSDQPLRDGFMRGAFSLIPPPPIPHQTDGRVPQALTRRELEVLRQIAMGKSNQEIAVELILSVRTVERHISTIYEKLGLTGRAARAGATAYAFTHHLVDPGGR